MLSLSGKIKASSPRGAKVQDILLVLCGGVVVQSWKDIRHVLARDILNASAIAARQALLALARPEANTNLQRGIFETLMINRPSKEEHLHIQASHISCK